MNDKSPRRYLVFAIETYYPFKGDLRGTYDSIEEAIAIAKALNLDGLYAYIVDRETLERTDV